MRITSIIREKFFNISLRFLERELLKHPVENLSDEEYDGLLSGLWDNQAFRKYCHKRNQKLIYNIAGEAGSEPEPRDKTRLLCGQRFEILLLSAKAQAAAKRRDKAMALKREANPN